MTSIAFRVLIWLTGLAYVVGLVALVRLLAWAGAKAPKLFWTLLAGIASSAAYLLGCAVWGVRIW
jgi:hypothetical protein